MSCPQNFISRTSLRHKSLQLHLKNWFSEPIAPQPSVEVSRRNYFLDCNASQLPAKLFNNCFSYLAALQRFSTSREQLFFTSDCITAPLKCSKKLFLASHCVTAFPKNPQIYNSRTATPRIAPTSRKTLYLTLHRAKAPHARSHRTHNFHSPMRHSSTKSLQKLLAAPNCVTLPPTRKLGRCISMQNDIH